MHLNLAVAQTSLPSLIPILKSFRYFGIEIFPSTSSTAIRKVYIIVQKKILNAGPISQTHSKLLLFYDASCSSSGLLGKTSLVNLQIYMERKEASLKTHNSSMRQDTWRAGPAKFLVVLLVLCTTFSLYMVQSEFLGLLENN